MKSTTMSKFLATLQLYLMGALLSMLNFLFEFFFFFFCLKLLRFVDNFIDS